MIENDLARRNDRDDVLPFLSVFYIALQYCLSVSVPVHVLSVPTIGPLGTGPRSPLGLLLLFHFRFLGLNVKAKIRRKKRKEKKNNPKKNTNEEGNSSHS